MQRYGIDMKPIYNDMEFGTELIWNDMDGTDMERYEIDVEFHMERYGIGFHIESKRPHIR